MALEGTFQDFGLADIFQMVALQKKTGVLTVRGGEGRVITISFERGMVVFADEFQRTEDERLGSLLVRTRHLSPEALARAMEIQASTSQRLGYILLDQRMLSAQDLRQALQLQVKESVFRIFRWQEGSYHFSPEPVTYDREMYEPLPAEFLLMEGVRMIDEWPIIEKKIPSLQVVFERIPAREPPPPAGGARGAGGGLEDILEIVEGGEGRPGRAGAGPALGPRESALLALVDGKRSVQELVDLGRMGEFETCKTLYGFLSLNLIRPREGPRAAPAPAPAGRPAAAPRRWTDYWVLLPGGALAALLFLFNPWGLVAQGFRSRESRAEVAGWRDEARLRKLHLALEVFYLEKQSYPSGLEKLVESGLLEPRELRARDGSLFPYRGDGKDYRLGE